MKYITNCPECGKAINEAGIRKVWKEDCAADLISDGKGIYWEDSEVIEEYDVEYYCGNCHHHYQILPENYDDIENFLIKALKK